MKSYVVICVLRRKQIKNEMFDDYDEAFDVARSMTENEGCISIILTFNKDSATWETKLKLYPSESC